MYIKGALPTNLSLWGSLFSKSITLFAIWKTRQWQQAQILKNTSGFIGSTAEVSIVYHNKFDIQFVKFFHH